MVEPRGMGAVVMRPKPLPGMDWTWRCVSEIWRADLGKGKAEEMASAAEGVEMMLRPWLVRKLEIVCVQYSFPFLEVQKGS
jgi:hypothetical protein